MTRAPFVSLLGTAHRNGVGLAALNVIHLETAEALVAAAEETGLPLVLQISQNCVRYHGGLAPIARATMALADASSATLCLHLDHADDLRLIDEAIALGFDSIMFDASTLSDTDNRRQTRDVVALAHAAGVGIEAELGEVGGKNGVHDPRTRTDPDDAARFVADTGVDALAVAVGSSHAMTDASARLDLALISRIADAVPVPLVLHGSSGVPDEQISAAVRAGMTKINVSTRLVGAFTAGVRCALASDPALIDSRTYLRAGRERLQAAAAALLPVISGPGGDHEPR